MGALKTIGIIILVIIIIAAGGLFYLLSPASAVPATLYVREGSVEVKSGDAWSVAQNGMELDIGNSVRTLADSLASIIFYDNSVVRLESNTEVNIKELTSSKGTSTVSLKQQTGEIWSKVLKLAGVGTDLEVETPTTVATIRGTAFGVVVRGNSTDVVVAEGKINTRSYQVKEGVKEFLADQNVSADEQATVSGTNLSKIKKSEIQENYKDWVKEQKLKDIGFIQELKIREVYRYEKLISLAKDRFKVTDERIKEAIINYKSEEEKKREIAKYPIVPKRVIERIDELNKEIKKLESEQ